MPEAAATLAVNELFGPTFRKGEGASQGWLARFLRLFRCHLSFMYCDTPPMPEGTDSTTVLDRMRLLADPVLARGWNLTSRLHILLWENARAL